jgi:L-idonate 5-dehydrogenase
VYACVAHGAGDLRVEERGAVEAGPGEVAVGIEFGGICGSDLHYYHDGGVGDFRIREPLVLGHEVVGRVSVDADGFAVGTAVGIHPATPCGSCAECVRDRRNICAYSNYLGSAARDPHIQGGFVQELIVPVEQVRVLPAGLELRTAVLAEPLSVALHAVRQAGSVDGKRVLVTGAGPIGLLVVAALRQAGAVEVIAVDLHETPLTLATQVGATSTIQVGEASWPDEIDVAIEASGTAAGLRTCLERVRRGGTVVQVGTLPPGDTAFAGNVLMTRELTLTGAFRFDHEFDTAIALLAGGLNVAPIVTHTFPLSDAITAFELASDRTTASKVLLDLSSV